MTAREFIEWQAFDRLEPVGEIRGDVRAGIIAAVIANAHRGRKGKAATPADFMPFLEGGGPRRMTPDQFKAAIMPHVKKRSA